MTPGLIQIIKQTCIERGEFTLASGAKSSVYLDLRKLTLSRSIVRVADAIFHVLKGVHYEAIGGPGFGAAPIVGAYLDSIIEIEEEWLTTLRGFLIRPEANDHGKAGRIIGPVRPGDRCVLVDDVTSSGGSLIDATDVLEAFGCTVVQAIVIVDRLAGARERLAERGIPLTALCTIDGLGIEEGAIV